MRRNGQPDDSDRVQEDAARRGYDAEEQNVRRDKQPERPPLKGTFWYEDDFLEKEDEGIW